MVLVLKISIGMYSGMISRDKSILVECRFRVNVVLIELIRFSIGVLISSVRYRIVMEFFFRCIIMFNIGVRIISGRLVSI